MDSNSGTGILCVIIAAVLWGSNYSVVKEYDMKDGMHFQFLLCFGIFLVGMLMLFISSPIKDKTTDNNNSFLPELLVTINLKAVMVGVLWCISNLLTVPIVKRIGLGMGFSIWSGVSLLLSYIIGRQAMFGLQPSLLTSPKLGDIGLLSGILSLVIFCYITPEEKKNSEEKLNENIFEPFIQNIDSHDNSMQLSKEEEYLFHASRNRTLKLEKFSGVGLGIFAGVLYGTQFVPVQLHIQKYISEREANNLPVDEISESMKFFVSQYIGTFICSSVVFFGYRTKKRLKAKKSYLISNKAWGWAVLSGVMWAVACVAGMLATTNLGITVGGPLCSNGAFLINNTLSYYLFKEVQQKENKVYFLAANVLNVISCFCLALSKA